MKFRLPYADLPTPNRFGSSSFLGALSTRYSSHRELGDLNLTHKIAVTTPRRFFTYEPAIGKLSCAHKEKL